MSHSTNVNRGFPQSYEDFASRNLRSTPFPVDLVVPPEVLLSSLWASRAPVPTAGPLSAFNFRVGLVDGAPASHVILPSMLDCPAHRLGHNLCVFAYVEGCESFVVGDLRFTDIWGIRGCVPLGGIDPGIVIPDAVAVRARSYLASVRFEWSGLMDVVRGRFPGVVRPDEHLLATLPAHRAVRVAQAQYQQIAFAAQLVMAAQIESSLLGAAGPAWCHGFNFIRRSLRHWVATAAVSLTLVGDDALLGVVPLAQIVAAYIRYKCDNRLADPSAPPAWASEASPSLRQLIMLFDISWPTEWVFAPDDVGDDLALVSRVVALHGLALGMQVPLLFMVPLGSSRHRLRDASYGGAAVASSAPFAATASHWAALFQSATVDVLPVILPVCGVGVCFGLVGLLGRCDVRPAAGLRRVRRVRCQDWLGRLRLEDSQQQSLGLSGVH